LDPELLDAGADNAGLSRAIASMLVIRHGKLVFERYFNGSEASHANSVASLSKSILSLLTGVAIDDGSLRLDTPISQILPADLVPRDDGLVVRHLLTMSGGLEWDEAEDSDEFDVRGTLRRDRTSPPGAEFAYSTGLTVLRR
jgi:CubicO group peptidase (beta-lactamase class C family)